MTINKGGSALIDIDSDGIPDWRDIDDDNDGINTIDEGDGDPDGDDPFDPNDRILMC